MAYDLFFKGKRSPIRQEDFAAWFRDREGYSVEAGAEGDGATYESERTRVYFGFSWLPGECALRVNLLRPHFFALEAAREARAFAEALALEVSVEEGGPWTDFDEDGFVTDWGKANRAAIRAMREEEPDTLARFDLVGAGRLRALWEWNDGREDAMAAYIDDFPSATISPVSLFRVDGAVEALMTWPIDEAIAVPDVASGVVLCLPGTDDLSTYKLVMRGAVEPLLERIGRRLEACPAAVLPAVGPNNSDGPLAAVVANAPSVAEHAVESVDFDFVLDRDAVEQG